MVPSAAGAAPGGRHRRDAGMPKFRYFSIDPGPLRGVMAGWVAWTGGGTAPGKLRRFSPTWWRCGQPGTRSRSGATSPTVRRTVTCVRSRRDDEVEGNMLGKSLALVALIASVGAISISPSLAGSKGAVGTPGWNDTNA